MTRASSRVKAISPGCRFGSSSGMRFALAVLRPPLHHGSAQELTASESQEENDELLHSMWRTSCGRRCILHGLRRGPTTPQRRTSANRRSAVAPCACFECRRATSRASCCPSGWERPAHVYHRCRCHSAHCYRSRYRRHYLYRADCKREGRCIAPSRRTCHCVQHRRSERQQRTKRRCRSSRFRRQWAAARTGAILISRVAAHSFVGAQWQRPCSAQGGHVSSHRNRQSARRLRIDEADRQH